MFVVLSIAHKYLQVACLLGLGLQDPRCPSTTSPNVTLIVCNTPAMTNWQSQLQSFSAAASNSTSFRIYQHHRKNSNINLEEYDVIITTYSTLGTTKKINKLLFSLYHHVLF